MTAPVTNRRFDRVVSPPSRSGRYPIRMAGRGPLRDVDWALTDDFPLDQREEGACVGFGLSAELSALPIAHATGNEFAFALYAKAQDEDRAMGYAFPGGATVLGGLRAAKALGVIEGYLWASRFEDIAVAVQSHGPVVMGTDWLSGMDTTDRFGLVDVSGSTRGGHCWTIVGYRAAHPEHGEVFVAINSWGDRFGTRGRFLIKPDGVRRLFERAGEAAIVTDSPVEPVAVDTTAPPTLGGGGAG